MMSRPACPPMGPPPLRLLIVRRKRDAAFAAAEAAAWEEEEAEWNRWANNYDEAEDELRGVWAETAD